MRIRTGLRIGCLLLSQVTAGCSGSGASAPSPIPQPTPTPTPSGRVSMKGTVRDTAFRALPGARVEVVDGPQAGLSAIADSTGEFSLAGAFDETTRFRATKEGHVPDTRTLRPFCASCNPNWWIFFSLEEVGPSVNVAGDYTMTFIADSTCAALPNEFRTRTYTTTLPSNAPGYVTVGGAPIYKDWNGLGFGVAGDYISFDFEWLVEQIAPNTFLAFAGEAAASIGTPAGSTIALPFDGTIDYCVTKSATGQFEDCLRGVGTTNMQCTSTRHQLILTRR